MSYRILLCLLLGATPHFQPIHANPWVPGAGEMQVYSTFSSIDSASKKAQNARARDIAALEQNLSSWQKQASNIRNKAQTENRELSQSEILSLGQIEGLINAANSELDIMKCFSERYGADISAEYGIGNAQSVGGRVLFANETEGNNKKTILLYYKYNFYNQNNKLLTFEPRISFGTGHHNKRSNFADLALNGGISSAENSYITLSIAARKFFSDTAKGKWGFVLATQEGVHLFKGIVFDNFAEYQYIKDSCGLYNNIVYFKMAFSRKWAGHVNGRSLTTQLGYFWKKSLNNKSYYLSGPVISLWTNI